MLRCAVWLAPPLPPLSPTLFRRRSPLSSPRSVLPAAFRTPPRCGRKCCGGAFSVQPNERIPFSPEFFADSGDTARARLAPLALVGLECAGAGFRGVVSIPTCELALPIPYLHCCRPAHLVGDMGVDIQRSATGHVPDDDGECLDIHAVFQQSRDECVPLWHNKDKLEKPCGATGWLVCPYSFSTKNGPQMGPAGGGEKPGLHLKDKFFHSKKLRFPSCIFPDDVVIYQRSKK